ncbi:hypothetical protein [Prauserella muralis]|uniref:Uncharacterized protein n=1 Tax=Prauserella muralis TaxID=588067 RepID=A0A2V4BAU1_9PSEU|nr:hypothetical protein [Prauserella muralis]PXY32266.1 hypothetical protein BAY60_08260 [Prauserella muralis]TWE24065.1 hypothetical protein FHX69_5372 [Prauserella muralis]
MHDRHHSGYDPTGAAGDTVTDEFPGEPVVDDTLRDAFEEPRRYLPPPGTRPRRDGEQPDEPETKLARRAKLAALILVIALLVASVVVAASLAQQEQPPGDEAEAAAELTGAAALGGLAMPGAGTGTDGFLSTSSRTGDTSTGRVRHAAATTSTGKLGTVREFYSRVGRDPEAALDLVDPALTGGDGADLVRAWRSIGSVTVNDLGEQDNGTVRAVVTMAPRHSGPVRVVQELGLTGRGDDAVISEAKLLSVQPG